MNLHTLDTARAYCDRIIAMRDGGVRFDGPPEALTNETVRGIYGTDDLAGDFDEAVTSTSLASPSSRPQEKRAVGA